MSHTNVTAIMLTLNESDGVISTLDSAAPAFDELSLLDGGSTDGTVEMAREWCEENGKDFVLTESTERELLIEGFGTQRRRAENKRSNDYTLSLDPDTTLEIKSEKFFRRKFQYDAYVHTRLRVDGSVMRDYALYKPEEEADGIRWRGLVHEEIRGGGGAHVSDIVGVGEAPLVRHTHEQASMTTRSSEGMFQHIHDGFNDGASKTLKKQHYLLKRAVDNDMQSKYLSDAWHRYYHNNKATVADHWEDIHEAYDLPYFTKREGHETLDNEVYAAGPWVDKDYLAGEPVMEVQTQTWLSYAMKKVADYFGKSEPVY